MVSTHMLVRIAKNCFLHFGKDLIDSFLLKKERSSFSINLHCDFLGNSRNIELYVCNVGERVNILIVLFLEIRVLEDNKELEGVLQDIAMPSVTHGTLKIGDFGKTVSYSTLPDYMTNINNVFSVLSKANPILIRLFILSYRPLVPDDVAPQVRQIQKISSAY